MSILGAVGFIVWRLDEGHQVQLRLRQRGKTSTDCRTWCSAGPRVASACARSQILGHRMPIAQVGRSPSWKVSVKVSAPAADWSTRENHASDLRFLCGAEGNRTPDPFHAMEVLCQLSYSPESGT